MIMRSAFTMPDANMVIIGVFAPLTAGNWIVLFGFGNDKPLLKALSPVNVCGLRFSNATLAESWESESVPEEILDAFRLNPLPSPTNAEAVMVPLTWRAVAGLLTPMPT